MDAEAEIVVKRRPGRQPGFSPARAALERRQAEGVALGDPPPITVVHRFGLPDLETMGAWLVERLRATYPHLPSHYTAPWLRGAMESNDNLFIRSDDAVLLARRNQRALSNQPFVEEVFCFVRNGAIDEGANLYRELRRWSMGLNVTEICVDYNSDVPLEKIEQVAGASELRYFSAIALT